jgi:hypothetical protein
MVVTKIGAAVILTMVMEPPSSQIELEWWRTTPPVKCGHLRSRTSTAFESNFMVAYGPGTIDSGPCRGKGGSGEIRGHA